MFFPFSFWDDIGRRLRDPSTLVAYWKLDEALVTDTRLNSVNNDYNLLPRSNSNEITDDIYIGSGKFNNSAKFVTFLERPGSTVQRLIYSGTSSGLTIGNNDFTLTFWVKPSGNTPFDVTSPVDIAGASNIIGKTDLQI